MGVSLGHGYFALDEVETPKIGDLHILDFCHQGRVITTEDIHETLPHLRLWTLTFFFCYCHRVLQQRMLSCPCY